MEGYVLSRLGDRRFLKLISQFQKPMSRQLLCDTAIYRYNIIVRLVLIKFYFYNIKSKIRCVCRTCVTRCYLANRLVLAVRENERRNIALYIYRFPQTIHPSIEDTPPGLRWTQSNERNRTSELTNEGGHVETQVYYKIGYKS